MKVSEAEIADDVVQNLGLLSIHGQSNFDGGASALTLTQTTNMAESSKLSQQTFLPLIVDHHKGASYNQGF